MKFFYVISAFCYPYSVSCHVATQLYISFSVVVVVIIVDYHCNPTYR